MKDLKDKLEKLRLDAEDYDLIAKLATDRTRREAFRRLAAQFRQMATELEELIRATPGET